MMSVFSVRRISPPHSRYLDAWRGCAAMAVLVAHLEQVFLATASPVGDALGTGAVMVFFVISGFFIRKSLDTGGDFFASRVNRIAAPFALAVILTIVLWFIAPLVFVSGDRTFVVPTTQSAYTLKNVIPTIFFVSWCIGGTIPANEPLWSLAYEVFYYVLVGVRKPKIALLALIAATAINLRVGLLGAVWFAGYWVAKLHTEDRLPRWPQWPFFLPALLTLPLMAKTTGAIIVLWQVVVGFAFAGHLLWILKRVPPDPGPIARSADWSYTLYLIHYPILLFAYGMGVPVLPSAITVLILAALIGPRIERIKILEPSPLLRRDSIA